MASPSSEVFFVFDATTGAPVTGAAGSLSFVTYKNDLGTNLSQPSFREIGGGAYAFDPVAVTNRGIVYLVDTGAGHTPDRVYRYVRPEDLNTDTIPTVQALIEHVRDFNEGKWIINKTGPDANKMVFYAADNTTVLKKFDLLDANGNPSWANPFRRVPA